MHRLLDHRQQVVGTEIASEIEGRALSGRDANPVRSLDDVVIVDRRRSVDTNPRADRRLARRWTDHVDAAVGRESPKTPDSPRRRARHDHVAAQQADRRAAAEFVEANAARSIDASQDQLDGAVAFQSFDLAETEPRIEELADTGDAVLASEVVVGGGGEVSHDGSFPGRDDIRGESVAERYRSDRQRPPDPAHR